MSALDEVPAPLGFGAAVLLMALFFVLAMGQALHVSRLVLRRGRSRLLVACEALLVVHLLAGFCVARAASQGFPSGITWLLWPTVLVVETTLAAIGLGLCARMRRVWMLPELTCVLLALPVCAGVATAWAGAVLALNAAVMAGRVMAVLVNDGRLRRVDPERDAMAEAVRLLPEGVLCVAGDDGRVLFANDAMRACLAGVGLPADLADLRGVWELLERRARSGGEHDAVLPEGLRLEVAPGCLRLFVRSESALRGRPCRWLVALDVTEEERAAAEVAAVARSLELAGDELRDALLDVEQIARKEALIAMRARVHDVIGQRLSILHRYGEDGVPNVPFEQVAALIAGMSAELRVRSEPDAATELSAVIDAFGLVGVEIRPDGVLPADPAAALLFARVVRECATNAVRHGRARTVDVRMGEAVAEDGARYATLLVSNDGVPCAGVPRPGGGLTGMRVAAEGFGASFAVCPGPPFAVEVCVPLPVGRLDETSGFGGDADNGEGRTER